MNLKSSNHSISPGSYTDTHCHLDFPEFEQHLTPLLNQCANERIQRVIVPSVSPKNWHTVLQLCQTNTTQVALFPALGIHPWYLNDTSEDSMTQLTQLISQNRNHIIALGETGIDGKIAEEQNNLSTQLSYFEQQVSLAKQFDLPLIVHHRKSHQQLVKVLNQKKPSKAGIIHGFSGSYQQAKHYIDLGFKLGIGGTISYERAKKTINTVSKLPLSSIVLETDAPAMPLAGYQGQNNSPLKLINVFDLLVEIRTESRAEIAAQLEENVDTVFFQE